MKVRTPYFGINTKSYMYGQKLVDFCKQLDELSLKYDIPILVSSSYIDCARIAQETKHVILSAQGMSTDEPGKGMGLVLPEALVDAGVSQVFLNHAACPMSLPELVKAVKRAKEVGLDVALCADSYEEIKMVSILQPEFIVCE